MKKFTGKTTLLALAAVLCGSVILANVKQSHTDNSDSFSIDKPVLDANSNNLATISKPNYSYSELFFKMTMAVVLVILFAAASMYISKRIVPKFKTIPAKKIQVLETAHLGHRKTVHLIRASGKLILIGCTNENITKLLETAEQPGTDFTVSQTDIDKEIK